MELKKSCGTADEEYAKRKEARAMETVAVAETIKILNDVRVGNRGRHKYSERFTQGRYPCPPDR